MPLRAAMADRRSWALEHLRVVEPIIDKDGGARVTVVIGTALPGLGLEAGRPITTVLGGHRTLEESLGEAE